MMGDSGYKGISADQDSRFKNKETSLLKSLKFPSDFDKKVDMRKVELSVIKPWIAKRVTELLGFEDDVVLEYVAGMLQEDKHPDPRKMQISLTGFLESRTGTFIKELWTLLLSAQVSPGGIPAIFVQQKKEEMQKKKLQEESMLREVRRKEDISQWDQGARGDTRGGTSRWDRGNAEIRNTNGPSDGRVFKDKQGNVTERVSDSGWGVRSGRVSQREAIPDQGGPSGHRDYGRDRHDRYERDDYVRRSSPPRYEPRDRDARDDRRYDRRDHDERRGSRRSEEQSRSRERRRRRSPYSKRCSSRKEDGGSSKRDSSDDESADDRPSLRDREEEMRKEQELREKLLRARLNPTDTIHP